MQSCKLEIQWDSGNGKYLEAFFHLIMELVTLFLPANGMQLIDEKAIKCELPIIIRQWSLNGNQWKLVFYWFEKGIFFYGVTCTEIWDFTTKVSRFCILKGSKATLKFSSYHPTEYVDVNGG